MLDIKSERNKFYMEIWYKNLPIPSIQRISLEKVFGNVDEGNPKEYHGITDNSIRISLIDVKG